MFGVGIDPDSRVLLETTNVAKTEIGESVDDQLLDRTDIGHGVGHSSPTLSGNRQDRIADELAGAVVGDVTPAISSHEFSAD
ncbi:unannotated protein [freshwater metagenome]|uniref:Unannotated protein n=1 Tax=freshwater metagenome TaxID=449393 RepID=A0A6J7J348_9ZZZZ